MRHRLLFGIATLVIGWILQVILLGLFPVGWPTPHILLLIVLALAGRGETNLAQSLGFFWGLALDVQSVSLFGCQAWVLTLLGYSASRITRLLNIEKQMTQMTVAGVASLCFWGGMALVDHLFRATRPERPLFPELMILSVLYDVFFAPLCFRIIGWWMRFWMELESSAFFNSGRRHVG